MNEIRQLIDTGRFDEAHAQLVREARRAEDFGTVRTLCRVRRLLRSRAPANGAAVHRRIALLGGATTEPMVEPLQLMLDTLGIVSTLHVGDYNTYAREMLDPASATVAFRPEITVLVTTPMNLPVWPEWTADAAQVAAAVDEACDYWIGLCTSLHAHTGCDIVLGNFHPLPLRPYGAAGTRLPGEPNRYIRAVNEALAERAPPYVHVHDVAELATLHGVYRWFDPRYWYHAKQPVSFECLVPYVRGLAHLIGALVGRSAKCLVVDLDNTLWGGVVGDDGPDRIAIGEGDAQGEAFAAFQRYLRSLKDRGVMLAVNSKNDELNALEPFRTRSEMPLRREDFVAFYANWSPKSENLRAIAAALNIGLDSLVFVDDNPVEREQVRQALPEVRVVELGDDPSDFAACLDRTGWFEAVALSEEDRTRSAMYTANAARDALRSNVTDYPAFLRSLEQRAVIASFDDRFVDRIAQLTNKTNQFNLTTRRLGRADLAAMIDSTDFVTAYVRLADRFGDNGLISVFAARRTGVDLWIDLWLMSCRVFNRGVEYLLMNHVVERARERGIQRLHGIYIPTAKNGIVRDLYPSLGFQPCGSTDGGDHWLLETEAYRPHDTAVALVEDYGNESGDMHHV
ncbi:MAG TPA: HAD-IIIC family phosphatase [Longimicrobiales bacterium]|nr:HAD-IIIC family phosphatase [Longimicrobiales bacterium]